MTIDLKKQVATDVNGDFLKDVSLWTVGGNAKNVNRLKVLCDYYLNSKAEHREVKMSHVLFVGRKGSGKSTLAHAYANSLGCSAVYQAEGSTLSMGAEDISVFLQKGGPFAAYLIHSSERLSTYCASVIVPVLRDNTLVVRDPFNRTEISKEPFDKLLMLSCTDLSKVNQGIFKNIDVVCPMEDLNDDEVLKTLHERLDYLGWHLQNRDRMLRIIVDLSNGDVSQAVQILNWSYRCAISVGQDCIGIKHLNMALHLLQ
jgi:Holliday junction resolvasome RuvABC ATP-dependent DNA helicase subunit